MNSTQKSLAVVATLGVFGIAFAFLRKWKNKRCGKIKIGYWAIRGLAAPLRMMCEYAGADYENTLFKTRGHSPNWDLSEWLNVKEDLRQKNPLINLPYVIDGDVVVTQSNACFTYLGRKFGLNGNTEQEVTKMEQILAQVTDFRNDAVNFFYGSDFEEKKFTYLQSVTVHYEKLDNWFRHQGTMFSASNNKPTTADFHLWEILDQHDLFAKFVGQESPLPKHKHLATFYVRFSSLPFMKKYVSSDLGKLPVNAASSPFQ